MTKIRYNELTKEQKEVICNGCGGKGGKLNPPDFMFTASCNHHDFNYWLGHTEEDRRKADKQFLEAMLNDISVLPFWKRFFFRKIAYTYYKAVRLFGKSFFYYAKAERTKEDLLSIIHEKEVFNNYTRKK